MDFNQFRLKYEKVKVKHFSDFTNTHPLVSVMVQTFNHEDYIRDCLESILSQKTDFEYEILLGEDNSTDTTRRICLEYARKYPEKIRLFLHHPENKISVLGITTGNFNSFYNLFETRGEYIAFCEGDDYWQDSTKLQTQVDFLKKNPAYSFCFHSFIEIDATKGEFTARKKVKQPNRDLEKIEIQYLKHHPLFSTVCFRKPEMDLPSQAFEVLNVDSFLLSYFGSLGKGKFISEIKPSVYRRLSTGSWSSKKNDQRLLLKINTLQKLEQYYSSIRQNKISGYFKTQQKKLYRSLLLLYLKDIRLSKSLQALKNSLL